MKLTDEQLVSVLRSATRLVEAMCADDMTYEQLKMVFPCMISGMAEGFIVATGTPSSKAADVIDTFFDILTPHIFVEIYKVTMKKLPEIKKALKEYEDGEL
jgi:hypothetical protein